MPDRRREVRALRAVLALVAVEVERAGVTRTETPEAWLTLLDRWVTGEANTTEVLAHRGNTLAPLVWLTAVELKGRGGGEYRLPIRQQFVGRAPLGGSC